VAASVAEREGLAQVFKALGDETRLRLVAELARRGEVTCGEFAALCCCSNSALTYHQRVLSEAGLITVRRAGQYRVLALRREVLEDLLPGLLGRLTEAEARRAATGRADVATAATVQESGRDTASTLERSIGCR
jgi:DNA-binding transcriptional ArsR family regulator